MGSEAKQYYFEIMPSFTNKDIVWFYPFVSKDGRSFGAAFKLNPQATRHLHAVSQNAQGKLMGARVAGAALTAVAIDRPVDDGVIVIWDGLTRDHLQLFQRYFPHVEDVQKARAAQLAPVNERRPE